MIKGYRQFISYSIFFFCFILFGTASAQQDGKINVSASITPTSIMIGQKACVEVDVTAPGGTKIAFPTYDKEMIPNVEILGVQGPDTLPGNDGLKLKMKYFITSFDSASYVVPFIPVLHDNDTIRSNSFTLNVTLPALSDSTKAYLDLFKTGKTDSIDLEKLHVFDIKNIRKVPFAFSDLIPFLIYGLIAIAIIVLIIIIYRLLKNKKEKGYFFKPKEVLPPHIKALKELDDLKSKKYLEKGEKKIYYSSLTDVLREYLQGRFGIDAMKMTSDEIIDQFRRLSLEDPSVVKELQSVLSIADMVKFAKFGTSESDDEQSFEYSRDFVEKTKPHEELPDTENGDKNANQK